MISNMADKNQTSTVQQVCIFLSEYASWLLGCGATCIRIEKNIQRMSEAFGVESDMAIMPSHIHLSVWNEEHSISYSTVRRIHKSGISFNINTQLSKLSWDIADRKITFNEAKEAFKEITSTKPENKWAVLILASLANMSFCRLFNGDPTSMLIVFLATLIGYRLKQVLLEWKVDVRVVFMSSAFVSSVIAAGAYLFGLGNTPEVAIGTSVLYLIPGIPYINSVSDMIDRHYICSFSRFIDAVILTASLSVGLCGGMLIMGLKWL